MLQKKPFHLNLQTPHTQYVLKKHSNATDVFYHLKQTYSRQIVTKLVIVQGYEQEIPGLIIFLLHI